MITIEKFTGDNMGGIVNIWAIPPSDIDSVELDENNVYELTLSSTDQVIKIPCSHESISLTENEVENDGGKLYKQQLEGIIPKDTPNIQYYINYIIQRYWVLVYKDNNDYFKLVGNKYLPLECKSELMIDKNTNSLNRHKIIFYIDQNSARAIFINDPF